MSKIILFLLLKTRNTSESKIKQEATNTMEHLDIWVFGVVAPDYMKDRRDLFYILADQIEIIGGAFKLHLPSGSQTGYRGK